MHCDFYDIQSAKYRILRSSIRHTHHLNCGYSFVMFYQARSSRYEDYTTELEIGATCIFRNEQRCVAQFNK